MELTLRPKETPGPPCFHLETPLVTYPDPDDRLMCKTISQASDRVFVRLALMSLILTYDTDGIVNNAADIQLSR